MVWVLEKPGVWPFSWVRVCECGQCYLALNKKGWGMEVSPQSSHRDWESKSMTEVYVSRRDMPTSQWSQGASCLPWQVKSGYHQASASPDEPWFCPMTRMSGHSMDRPGVESGGPLDERVEEQWAVKVSLTYVNQSQPSLLQLWKGHMDFGVLKGFVLKCYRSGQTALWSSHLHNCPFSHESPSWQSLPWLATKSLYSKLKF